VSKPLEDPKKELTRFLTREPDGSKDLSTEFPSSEAVRLQLFYRTLGEEYDLEFFRNQADRVARIMWSFRRKSREEAVKSMFPLSEWKQQFRRRSLVEPVENEGETETI